MAKQFRTSYASRERNRVHARKTRERKKNQMKTLQTRAEDLKEEQMQLKQQINEKSTASILVGLFATAGESEVSQQNEDPEVEFLLRRPAEEIPDASKITELPALILPGQHNAKKSKAAETPLKEALPDDGIDYDLLGKDRSKCTPEELDKIRRERNRMHAKRTRDRKRLFMEEMSEMCKKLEEENTLLRNHLKTLDAGCPATSSSPDAAATTGNFAENSSEDKVPNGVVAEDQPVSENGVTMDQLKTLIEAAGTFERKTQTMKGIMSLSSVASSVATAVSASDSNNSSAVASDAEDHEQHRSHLHDSAHPAKRRRLGNNSGVSFGVPRSINASC